MRLLGLAMEAYGWLFGTFCSILISGVGIWEVNRARLTFWRGVGGTGGMTRFDECFMIDLRGY